MKYIYILIAYLLISITLFANQSSTNKQDSSLFKNQKNTLLQSNISLTKEELQYIQNKKTIVVANELDWIPFDFYEEGLPKGYVIDYIKLISGKIGLNVDFITDKWAILYEKFKQGDIDVLPVISYSKKREDIMVYSNEYLYQELSIITKESVTNIINIDDLKSKKIGMIKTWNTTKLLRKNYPELNIIEFDSLKDLFDAIKNNFIDATIQNKLLARYYINKDFNGYIKAGSIVKIKGHKKELYMGIQKDQTILKDIVNKAIKAITAREIEILDKKWINYGSELTFTKEENEFIKNNLIQLTITKNWAPFLFKDSNKTLGISYDFWEYIVDKAKLKVKEEENFTFNSDLEKLKNKEKDIILATSKTKDRMKYAIFSDSYFISPLGIATLQDKNYINKIETLFDKKVAVGKNFSAHKLLIEKYPNLKLTFVNSVYDGLKAVSENKVFAYIDIMPVLTYNIEKEGFSNIKISGDTGIDFKLRFMIRDDYQILRTIINKTLAQIPFEDKENIINKWLKVKIEEKFDYSILWKTISVFLIIILFILYKNRQMKEYQTKLEYTQKGLQNSLKNFKTLIDFNIAGIFILQNNHIIYMNDEILNILGYKTKVEFKNKKIDEIIVSKDDNNLKKDIEDLYESYDYLAIKKNGTHISVVLKAKEIYFDNKKSFIISIVDLTEIKKNEEVIIQQSKLASLGEMIGNIAHQWRQPLSSISTTASGMKLQKEYGQLNDKELYDHLDTITSTTKFLSDTIDDFRNYIKEDKEKKEFNIHNSIEKVLSIMRSSFINHFINIQKDIESNNFYGYENELNQVLLNILTNSKDALKNIDEKNRYVFIKSYRDHNNVIIKVIDTGGGIPIEIIDKIFEPYFTTKHKSQGTGLGLYMTHKIIHESMNGEISIKNCSYKSYDKCTEVTITIPKNL